MDLHVCKIMIFLKNVGNLARHPSWYHSVLSVIQTPVALNTEPQRPLILSTISSAHQPLSATLTPFSSCLYWQQLSIFFTKLTLDTRYYPEGNFGKYAMGK